MSKNLNISVLVAARDEYIEQLKCIICPLINQGFMSIYNDAYAITNGDNTIYKFQELLKAIPTWNQTILQNESKRIKKKCPYIMDIVTAIFVSNVKILASIRLSGESDNIKVKIPTSDLFIHSVYIEAAYNIFYDPFLYYHRTKHHGDVQRNKDSVNGIIRNAINETIRQMLPFDNILQEYLKSALDDNISDSDSDSSSDTDSENNININKIVNSNGSEYSDSDQESDNNDPDNEYTEPEPLGNNNFGMINNNLPEFQNVQNVQNVPETQNIQNINQQPTQPPEPQQIQYNQPIQQPLQQMTQTYPAVQPTQYNVEDKDVKKFSFF